MQSNDNGVVPPNALSYDEAIALVGQAEALEAVIENHGPTRANTYAVRRALQQSKRILAAAQVSATLAVADELRQVRDMLASGLTEDGVFGMTPPTVSGPVDMEAVAEQVSRVLERNARRMGRTL